MKQETITRVKLTASEGMVLTNGTHHGTVIFLAEGESAEAYHEIAMSEYETMLAEQEAEAMRNV